MVIIIIKRNIIAEVSFRASLIADEEVELALRGY
jgi:hypothetical protein